MHFLHNLNYVILPLFALQNHAVKNWIMPGQSQYICLKSDMTKLCTKSYSAIPNIIQCYKCPCTFSGFSPIGDMVSEQTPFAQLTRCYSKPLFSFWLVGSSFSYLVKFFSNSILKFGTLICDTL